MAPTPTHESDGSPKEGVEVAASGVDVGLQPHPVSSLGEAAVEDAFPYHNLQRQEGSQWAQWVQVSYELSLNTPPSRPGKDGFSSRH